MRRNLSLLLAVSALMIFGTRIALRLHAQLEPGAASSADPAAHTVLLRFGVTDKSPNTWKGRIEGDGGDATVVSLKGYHFQATDRVDGANFEFATRTWVAPQFTQVDLSPARPGPRIIFPNGIYVTVKGGAGARFRVTGAGDLKFALSDLNNRRMLTFADGNIEAELVADALPLSGATGEADFPGLAAGPEGRMAIAWQEFRGQGDYLAVREENRGAWAAADFPQSKETQDIFRPAVAYDGQGALHAIWAAQVDGNWDLYERRKRGSTWGAVERLTQAPGSDFHQKLASDENGDLWLAWQGFRNGQSDIFLKRFTGGAWGGETRVSESAANDWEPALAAAPGGGVWVGWDSYDRGNYDVFVRSFAGGKPGPVRAITKSPRFEAHVSLACDSRGRLWIGFDEAEANWGKDYGYLVKDRGNPLYQSRRLRVVRLNGDRIEEPDASLDSAFPLGVPAFLQNPQLAIAPDGKLSVLGLQLTHSNSVIEVWGSGGVWEEAAFTLDGAGWHRHQVLPQSAGANDVRAAIVNSRDGSTWAAWAADLRSFQAGAPQRQTILAAKIPEEPGAGEIRMKPFVEQQELSFVAHPDETANVKTVRDYRIQSAGDSYRIVRGDLHRHTSLSADGVGDGSLWEFYRYALDAAGLDFSTVTDHQGGGTAYNWWKCQKSTDLFLNPGRLTTIYAYERSVLYPNGHRNIVFAKKGVPILPIDPRENAGPASASTIRSSDAVWPYLKQYNGIAFRHTSATNQGTDWKDHNNDLEPMVEIYQGHRVVYEHEGGPKGATAEKLYMQRSGYQPAGYVWNALAKGYRLGFEAASDHCSTHISYSCILTQGDSREAIIDAMRKRHSYGATDNIVMDFRVRADGREYIQGDETPALGRYTLSVNAIGTGPVRRVDVIHNESYAYALTPVGKSSVNFTYSDPRPAAGENRYYVRLQQEDGNLAWSSPIWVHYSAR